MGKKDLTGQRFGYWYVIEPVNELYDGAHTFWKCRCDCGNIGVVRTDQLTRGISNSCGCYGREQSRAATIKRNTTHGLRRHSLYRIWHHMRERCLCKNDKAYRLYGARGIYVCDEWKDDFKAFYDWSIANGWRKGLTIDRIDNDGPYAPWNCRWVTQDVQNKNKRTNVHLIVDGKD